MDPAPFEEGPLMDEETVARQTEMLAYGSSRPASMTDLSSMHATEKGCNPLWLLRHHDEFVTEIFKSAARERWATCKRAIRLFPHLKFRSSLNEADYSTILNDNLKLRRVAHIHILVSLIIWVLTYVSFLMEWLAKGVETNSISLMGAIVLSGSLIANLFLRFPGYFQNDRLEGFLRHKERMLYAFHGVITILVLAWAYFAVSHVNKQIPFEDELHNSMGRQDVLYVKMWFDTVTLIFMIMNVIHVDIYLDTLSRRSLYYHLLLLGAYILFEALTAQSLHTRVLWFHNGLHMILVSFIYVYSWSASWYHELQHRATVISIRDTKESVRRIRELQTKQPRRPTQSDAEQLLDLFLACQQGLEDRRRKAEKPIIKMLQLCQAQLSNNPNYSKMQANKASLAHSRSTSKKGTMSELGRRSDYDQTAFASMYRNTTDAGAPNKPRRTSGVHFSGRSARVFHSDEAPSKIGETKNLSFDGVTIPALFLQDKLSKIQWRESLQGSVLPFKNQCVNVLMEIGFVLLTHLQGFFSVPQDVFMAVLYAMHTTYWEGNSYHNSEHAAQTAFTAEAIVHAIELKKYMTDLDSASLTLAALAIDLGHPGRGGQYYFNSYLTRAAPETELLCLLANENAVLESAHNFLLQAMIGRVKELDLFAGLTAGEQRTLRKNIQTLILSTDMLRHFDAISKFRLRRCSPDFDCMLNENDKQSVLCMILKAADFGFVGMEFEDHLSWVFMIRNEGIKQGDDEARHGLPVTPMCERTYAEANMNSIVSGHITFIVIPLYQELAEADATHSVEQSLLAGAMANKNAWDFMAETLQIPEHLNSLLLPDPAFPVHCIKDVLSATRYSHIARDRRSHGNQSSETENG